MCWRQYRGGHGNRMRYKPKDTSLPSHFLFAKDCCCLAHFSFPPCLPVQHLSRLCRCNICCSLAPKPEVSQNLTLSHICRGNCCPVIDCRWTQVSVKRQRIPCADLLPPAGCFSVCWNLKHPRVFHPQASRASGLWSCLLLPLLSSLSSSPDTQLLELAPQALPSSLHSHEHCWISVPQTLAFLALAVALLILTHCVQFVNLFWFSWPQFGLLFLILTVYPPKHLECPMFPILISFFFV